MGRFNLASAGDQFANELQLVLNRTITDDARVVSLTGRGRCLVGTNLDGRFITTAVPLRSTSSQQRCWIDIRMTLEDQGGHLTMLKSYIGISAVPDGNQPIFHYDYDRGKSDYTEAHLQIFGENVELTPLLEELCTNRKKKTMGELHFPVGGRRYRPSLEDVIEFLVDEKLVNGKPGWKAVLEEGRDKYRAIQLRAAIRRDPDVAAEVLRGLRYEIKEPLMAKLPKIRGKSRNR